MINEEATITTSNLSKIAIDKSGISLINYDERADCISRQAVLDALDKSKYSNEFCEEHHIDWSINLGMAHIVVNGLKPVTPQQKIGHWINLEKTKYKGRVLPFWHRYECSKCGGHGEGTFNYCPNCGARMIERNLS